MAHFFSLQDGSLTNISTYGYSLTGAEIMNNTTGTMLLTSTGLYSANVFSDGSTLSAIAVHLSARAANPTGTLGLTLQRTASAGVFLDSSSNNFSITPAALAYQNTFSPFSPNGWNGYFNGSTSYLLVSSNPALAIGTGDFTLECWVYKNATNTNSTLLEINRHDANTGVVFLIESSSTVSIPTVYSNIFFSPTNVPAVGLNKWTHIAYVRQAGNLKIYVDGIGSSSVAFGNNISTVTNFSIGYVAGQNGGGTYYYNGCLSNFRLIKGQAIYTTNFTPPTAAFGLTDNGGAIGATATPLASNVSILTLQDNRFKDNSNNNLTLTAFGSVAVKDTSPFTPVTINPAVHGGSGLFKNSPIYLQSSSTQSLSFGTGDFTVEFWIYPMANLGVYESICDGPNNDSLSIQTQANDNRLHITTTVAIPGLTPNRPLILNQWNHFAATRSSGSLMLYVNGLSSAQVIGNTTNFTALGIIGGQKGGAYHLKNSYLSNFRVIKGTALYTTATITPSTSPLTNISGTSLLLNTNNYGFRSSITETYAISSFTSFDGSNNLLTQHPQNWQVLKLTNPLSTNNGDVINYTLSTSNPNQLSLIGRNSISATDITGINLITSNSYPLLTSISPFITNENSFAFNGTSNFYTLLGKPELLFGTQDFTIECWIYPTTIVGPKQIYSNRTTSSDVNTNVFGLYYTSTGKLQLFSGDNALGTGTQTVSANTWQHVAFTRFNGAARIYLNGVMSCSGTLNRDFTISNTAIGANYAGGAEFFVGAISNLRVVNGTAVYTTSSFSPPTTPLTVIPNTVFLLKNGARYDQALISNQILKTGNLILNGTQLSSANPFGSGLDSSIRFNGNGDYIQVLYKNSNWSTTNYSLEFWFYWTGGTGQQRIFSNTTQGLQLCLAVGGTSFGLYDGSSGATFSNSPSKNVWHHLYINRSSGTIRAFLNGTQIYTGTDGPNVLLNTFTIGGEANNSNSFGGFLSNLRISNKPFYTPVNNTITVPTRPLDPTDIVNIGVNFLINTNSYNLSSFYDYVLLNDIHIGSGLKSLNTESCTVTANTFTLDNLYIHNQGTLTFPLSNTTLNVNGSAGLQITSDGTLNIGTSSTFVPSNTTHTINLSNTQIDVHNGGNFNVYGYPELTTTSLVSTHPIGSRTFTTTRNISSDWKVGDILSFKPNLSARTSFDTLILSSFIAPNVFTTTSSSLCTHTGSADQFAFIPDVYNLTRNVTIQGLSAIARGTIRTVDAAKTNVSYAQLSNFGINSLNKTGFVLGNNSSGNTILSGIVINSDNTTTVNNIAPLTGRAFQNVTINNSIINRSNTITISSLSVNNINVSNNYILSSGGIGIRMNNLSGSINMSNNTTIGSLGVGTHLFNTSLTGTYGALNYNSALQGMIISGANTGTIVGGSINSLREGVYVDASTSNLSSVTFQNIIASNNSSVGFKVSGNNLNYLTPISLNVNGLTANSNLDNGFEAYNIIGNLSSLIITNNMNTNIRTSIGNGPTTFNGLTSLVNNSPTISSGIALLNSPTAVSSLSSPPYSGGIEGSLYFTGNSYANLPYSFNVMTDTVTLEGWIYVQTYATNWISFTTYPGTNRVNTYNGILGINSTGRLEFYNFSGNPASMISTSSVQLSSWTHFAITLSAKVIKFYINGIEVSPAANTIITSSQVTTVNSMLGSQLNAETAMQFFISNYRISNNLRYNGNFSVPSFPIVNADANTLLLYKNPYNNTFLTSSVNTNNLNVNILSGYNYSRIYIKDASIGKFDTYPSLSAQLIMDSTRFSNFSLENSVVTGGGLVNPILLNATRNLIEGSYLFNNTNLGSINFIDLTKYQPSVTRTSGFGFTNHNKIAGNHFTYLPMGLKAADTSLYDTSTSDLISERLTPTSRTMKLCSGTKYVALNSGETTLVKVNILVSSSYTGNLPRLMLRRNAAAGVYSDTILSVFNPNLGYDTFTQLIGIQTPAVIDNAVLEFYVDCDGTTGYVCVDTWTAN